ncbi:Fic family protein [Helicobacter sp. T3_23-1059]
MQFLDFLDNQKYALDLCVRMAHHSTAIEGNTLTQDETASILLDDYIPKQMNMREFYEVKNYKQVLKCLIESLNAKKQLNPKLIKHFHALCLENLLDNKGEFKKVPNVIIGATFETLPPYQVPTAMQEWCNNLYHRFENAKNDDDKLQAILESHIHFEKIHPFSDGNGRIGRLLIVYSCIEQNLPPAIIQKDSKAQYISIIRNNDIQNFMSMAKDLQKQELHKATIFQAQEKEIVIPNNAPNPTHNISKHKPCRR